MDAPACGGKFDVIAVAIAFLLGRHLLQDAVLLARRADGHCDSNGRAIRRINPRVIGNGEENG